MTMRVQCELLKFQVCFTVLYPPHPPPRFCLSLNYLGVGVGVGVGRKKEREGVVTSDEF